MASRLTQCRVHEPRDAVRRPRKLPMNRLRGHGQTAGHREAQLFPCADSVADGPSECPPARSHPPHRSLPVEWGTGSNGRDRCGTSAAATHAAAVVTRSRLESVQPSNGTYVDPAVFRRANETRSI